SENKLRESIKRAGVAEKIENRALVHIKSRLHDNIKTSEIYSHISEFLGQSSNPYARAKYSLKKSIMDLGPTGYPFEDFIADLLNARGYQTKVRQILKGRCVSHEIDVLASRNNKNIMIEAKFHNRPGLKTELHVSLYTKARFDDIKEINGLDESWLITNTKATSEAIAYGACSNMTIITWDEPDDYSLRRMIEKEHLYPITVMNTISEREKQILLENHIVLCRDILKNTSFLSCVGMEKEKKKSILDEAGFVCSG
ncbi:restriction endonuclease, partial [Patescibacteria group bacterium]|nr:restriction endonuclease [Patescibacteria group bacterium]